MMTNSCTYDFTGAKVLVTGGTSGIGYAIARDFADAGASVTITGTRGSADDYADDPVDLDRFEFLTLDTRDKEAVDALAASVDVLDVLINNAGAPFAGGLDEASPDGFEASLEQNLEGAVRLTMGLHDALAASTMAGGASVVSIVSMSAYRGVPAVMGYSASKAALVATTRNLALAWMADGIRVNAVAPGLIKTRLTAPLADMPELEEILDKELARVPQGRMGTPEECAAAALFLCTELSAYTTGVEIAVDGGYLAL